MHSRIEQFGQDSSGLSDYLQHDTMVFATSRANDCPIQCVASIADLMVVKGLLEVGSYVVLGQRSENGLRNNVDVV